MMTPKSLAYMVVAMFVGYMLVSAVPNQAAMYATSTFAGEGAERVTVTGSEFSTENETLSSEIDDFSKSSEDVEESSDAFAEIESSMGQAASDAAEAVNAVSDVRSVIDLMGTMGWLTVNMFVALVVYWIARRGFA